MSQLDGVAKKGMHICFAPDPPPCPSWLNDGTARVSCAIGMPCLQAFFTRLPSVPAPKIRLKLGGRKATDPAGRAGEVMPRKRMRKEVEAAQEVRASAQSAAESHIK